MRKILALGTLCAAATLSAQSVAAAAIKTNLEASNFNNTWLEVAYASFDGGLRGIRAEGSSALDKNLNIIGSLGFYSDSGYDSINLSGGASYAFGIDKNQQLDIVPHAELAYSDNDADNDFGIIFGAEARFQALKTLEVYADVSYTTVWKNDLMVEGGVRFKTAEHIQITAGLQLSDNDLLYIGGRFDF